MLRKIFSLTVAGALVLTSTMSNDGRAMSLRADAPHRSSLIARESLSFGSQALGATIPNMLLPIHRSGKIRLALFAASVIGLAGAARMIHQDPSTVWRVFRPALLVSGALAAGMGMVWRQYLRPLWRSPQWNWLHNAVFEARYGFGYMLLLQLGVAGANYFNRWNYDRFDDFSLIMFLVWMPGFLWYAGRHYRYWLPGARRIVQDPQFSTDSPWKGWRNAGLWSALLAASVLGQFAYPFAFGLLRPITANAMNLASTIFLSYIGWIAFHESPYRRWRLLVFLLFAGAAILQIFSKGVSGVDTPAGYIWGAALMITSTVVYTIQNILLKREKETEDPVRLTLILAAANTSAITTWFLADHGGQAGLALLHFPALLWLAYALLSIANLQMRYEGAARRLQTHDLSRMSSSTFFGLPMHALFEGIINGRLAGLSILSVVLSAAAAVLAVIHIEEPTLSQIRMELGKIKIMERDWPAAVQFIGPEAVAPDSPLRHQRERLGRELYEAGLAVRALFGRGFDDTIARSYAQARPAGAMPGAPRPQTQAIGLDEPFAHDLPPIFEMIVWFLHPVMQQLAARTKSIGAIAQPGDLAALDLIMSLWRNDQPPVLLEPPEEDSRFVPFFDILDQQLRSAQLRTADPATNQVRTWPPITNSEREAIALIRSRSPASPGTLSRRELNTRLHRAARQLEAGIKSLKLWRQERNSRALTMTFAGHPGQGSAALAVMREVAGRAAQAGCIVRIASTAEVFASVAEQVRGTAGWSHLQSVLFRRENRDLTSEEKAIQRQASTESETIHQVLMTANSDIFVFGPGAIGTLHKVVNILRLFLYGGRRHEAAPLLVLVDRRFWEPIMGALDIYGFIPALQRAAYRKLFVYADTSEEALEAVSRHTGVAFGPSQSVSKAA